jgi:hypothetical protein
MHDSQSHKTIDETQQVVRNELEISRNLFSNYTLKFKKNFNLVYYAIDYTFYIRF